jgi:hypothetical protein
MIMYGRPPAEYRTVPEAERAGIKAREHVRRARPFASWEQPRAPVASKLNHQRRLRSRSWRGKAALLFGQQHHHSLLLKDRRVSHLCNSSEEPAVQGWTNPTHLRKFDAEITLIGFAWGTAPLAARHGSLATQFPFYSPEAAASFLTTSSIDRGFHLHLHLRPININTDITASSLKATSIFLKDNCARPTERVLQR